MRIDDGGGSAAAPPPPPPAPVKHAAAATAVPTDPGLRQGSASTTQWPGGPDSIDLKGLSGPVLRMVKQEQAQDAESGTFANGSYPESQDDARIASSLAQPIAKKVGDGQPLSQNDTYYLNQYVAGKMQGQDRTNAPQRLQNALAALGPQASAQWLQQMSGGDYKNLGIQKSFDSLASSGKLTPADARAFADGDTANNMGPNPNFLPSTVASLVSGLGNDTNSSAFKNAYAHQEINDAEQLTSGLNSNQYKGETANQARTERTMLYGQATAALDSMPNDDSAKRAAFTQMTADANALSGKDGATADKINAFAADVIGGASPAAIAKQFASMGGVGKDNAIAASSQLGKFLTSAVAGQASFGTDPLYTGLNAPPNGVSKIMNSLAGGSDPNLTQAVLSHVLQSFVANPDQAQALTSQDAVYHTGLQKSLSDALDSSFDRYLGRNGKVNVDPQQGLELSVLSGIESGPPFESGAGKQFADMMQSHAQAYGDYALGIDDGAVQNREIAAGFKGDPASRKLAADTAFGIMQSYQKGFSSEQASLVAAANGATSSDNLGNALTKIQDGTTLIAAIPGDVPGQGAAATVATIAGVVGALRDAGVIPQHSDAGAVKAANAKLDTGLNQSGAPLGASDLQNYYNSLYTKLYNQDGSNDPYVAAGASKPGLSNDDAQESNFFTNYQPPIHQDY